MAKIYQKREIVILDIHNRIDKQMIDSVFQKNGYRLSSSKMDNRPNVEFINSGVANDVKKFLDNKELIYNNRPFKFSLKGNRISIGGMNEVPFDKIKNFFQSYGEVNNVYYTKRYFATLTSIQQAIELVEKVRTIMIDNTPVEIKYAFDHNIGNANSPNKDFKLKIKDKTGEFIVKNKPDFINDKNKEQSINIELFKPINIELGNNKNILKVNSSCKSNLNSINSSRLNLNESVENKRSNSKTNLNSINSSRLNLNEVAKNKRSNNKQNNQNTSNQQNNQQNQVNKSRNRRERSRKNRSSKSSSSQSDTVQQFSGLNLNEQTQNKKTNKLNKQLNGLGPVQNVDPKVNSLRISNPNIPLFSKGPSSNNFSIFEKLDHKNDQFKSINYLDKFKPQQEKQSARITTTYFNTSSNEEEQKNDVNLPTVLPFQLNTTSKQKSTTNQNSNDLPSTSKAESTIQTKFLKSSGTIPPLTFPTDLNTSPILKTTNQTKSTIVDMHLNLNANQEKKNHSPNQPSTKPKTINQQFVSHDSLNNPINYFGSKKQSPKKDKTDNCSII